MDRAIEKKKWPASKIITILVGLTTGILLIYLLSNQQGSRLKVDVNRISTAQVKVGEFQEYIPITGNVLPHTTVFLDLEEGGIVEKIYVQGGVPIEKGDLILGFSNTTVQKQNIDSETRLLENLNQLRNSKYANIRQNLQLKDQLLDLDQQILETEKTFQRYELLIDNPNAPLPKEQYETTRDQLIYLKEKRKLLNERIRQETILQEQQNEQIDDSIERVNRSLEILTKIIDSLEVRAPISGHLSSMNAEIGQNFTRGQRIGQIDQLDSFKVRADIDQYYISRVTVGQQGSFDFNGTEYRLEVSKIYPEVSNGAFQVDLEFIGNIANGIKRGQSLQIDLALGESKNSKLVAKGGFYRHTNGRWVYKVSEDGLSASRVDIVAGRQNPQNFEILEGLETGDWIISSGYDVFNDADTLTFSEPVGK
ncbi:efflux RND transporter periplasmic adaptor subunit [Aurantivibrio infirmus]